MNEKYINVHNENIKKYINNLINEIRYYKSEMMTKTKHNNIDGTLYNENGDAFYNEVKQIFTNETDDIYNEIKDTLYNKVKFQTQKDVQSSTQPQQENGRCSIKNSISQSDVFNDAIHETTQLNIPPKTYIAFEHNFYTNNVDANADIYEQNINNVDENADIYEQNTNTIDTNSDAYELNENTYVYAQNTNKVDANADIYEQNTNNVDKNAYVYEQKINNKNKDTEVSKQDQYNEKTQSDLYEELNESEKDPYSDKNKLCVYEELNESEKDPYNDKNKLRLFEELDVSKQNPYNEKTQSDLYEELDESEKDPYNETDQYHFYEELDVSDKDPYNDKNIEELNVSDKDPYNDKNKLRLFEELYESKRHELELIENQYPHLIRKDSPSLYVGEMPNFCDVKEHMKPMLSIEHTYNLDDAYKKIENMLTQDSILVMQEKIDGVAVSLQYMNGYLDCALLRGDGKCGEDIINIINYVTSIPKKISYTNTKIEIRGELYFPNNVSNEHIRTKLAGTLRRKECRDYCIKFVAYDASIHRTHTDNYDFLKSCGFRLSHQTILTSLNDFKLQYKIYETQNYEYEVDGVVVKLNHKIEEYTARYTKGIYAIKYNRSSYLATVKNISWTMGRQNQCIPTINIESIIIDNMNINNISGHNYLFLQNKKIDIGSVISIARIGNTAPQIINVVSGETSYILSNCPFCKEKIIIKDIHAVCSNENCQAKKVSKYTYFLESFDILGLGSQLILRIIKMYNYNHIEILQGLLSGDWVSNKNDEKVFSLVQKYNFTKRNLILSMGWPSIGASTLDKYFRNNELIGELPKNKTAQALWRYYGENKELLDRLYQITQNSIHY